MTTVDALVLAQNLIRQNAPDTMPNLVARVLGDVNTLVTEASRLHQKE